MFTFISKSSVWKLSIIIFVILLVLGFLLYSLMGDGAFKRHFTWSGLTTICKPGNYDMVCVLDADSKDGGLSCLPLSQVGGKCNP